MLRMNKLYKGLLIGSLISAMMFAAAGCSRNGGEKSPATTIASTIDPENPPADEDLTAKLEKEKEVMFGQVLVRDDLVSANIVAKDEASKDDLQKLADKYADLLNKKYTDKKIRVQVLKGGESIVDERRD